MTQPQDLYAWAAGFNVAQNSLTTVISVVASGDTRPFPAPVARGYYDPGQRRSRTDGLDFFSGFNNLSWFWAALTWNQYAYIYNTILGGAYSGPVTIYTRLGFDAYTRMNAIAHLPKQVETDGKFFAPKKVELKMSRLVASS